MEGDIRFKYLNCIVTYIRATIMEKTSPCPMAFSGPKSATKLNMSDTVHVQIQKHVHRLRAEPNLAHDLGIKSGVKAVEELEVVEKSDNVVPLFIHGFRKILLNIERGLEALTPR